jgi:hypothetical protein
MADRGKRIDERLAKLERHSSDPTDDPAVQEDMRKMEAYAQTRLAEIRMRMATTVPDRSTVPRVKPARPDGPTGILRLIKGSS